MNNDRITPENIQPLEDNEIFVFGSNLAGIHGKGAALLAKKKFGAEQGVGEGRTGQCYAIPIKDARDRNFRRSLSLHVIETYIHDFVKYAVENPRLIFLVTQIGCGLGGYRPKDIAPLFPWPGLVSGNIYLPQSFWDCM